MKAKFPWLILILGAWLLASCTMVPMGDYNISVRTKTAAHPYFRDRGNPGLRSQRRARR